MDVTCPRCATEYEFDETLVSDRGTTVKCTNCGHLFKVYPPGAQPGAGERAWIVRRKDGTEEELASLKDLQQRITQGDVDENDQISRSGEAWKRLGDIAELQTFFRAAKAARSAPPKPKPAPTAPAATAPSPKKQTLVGFGGAAPASPPATSPRPRTPPPPRPPPKPPQSKPPPSATPVKPPPRAPGSSVSPEPPRVTKRPPRPPSPRESAKTEIDSPRPPARPAAPTIDEPRAKPASPRQRLYLDHDEDARAPVVPQRGPRWGLLLVVLILGAGGAAAALKWDVISAKLGLGGESPAAAFLDAGDTALGLDTEDGYGDAVREYTRASAHDERDPRTLTSLSTAHAAWAQMLAFQASDLEARAVADPTLAGEAARLRRDSERHASEAKESAEEMVRAHPADARGELALADALRLQGELDAAQTHLDRSQEMFDDPPAEFHLVRALIAMGPNGDVAGASAEAEAAVSEDGDLLRARLLLARAALATGNVETARRQIDAVLRKVDNHPAATDLADAIERGLPPAAPVVALDDAGLVDAPDAPDAGSETPTMEATPPTMQTMQANPDNGSMMGGGAVPAGRDYSWYIRRGDSLLGGGDYGGAREHFEAAERLRPGSVEALTGLGQVALRQGNASEAARRFRPAARADYGDAYIGLADAYQRMGRTDEAVRTYRAYLNSRPTGPHATLARRRIEALEQQAPPTMDPATMDPAPTMDPPPAMEPAPADPPPAPEPAPEPTPEP